ncbi:hypothetical protein ABH920_004575 [Catenulispora sp. EB89]|uniref:hypothetical protein n=1 Tax=Catenulispora sp. EB89 TaxID=3156257 RepID=UPI003517DF8D
MSAEPVMNQDTLPTEPTHRWADDGGVLTEERLPVPESVPAPEPETPMEVTTETPMAAEPEEPEAPTDTSTAGPTDTTTETTSTPVVHEPLLSHKAEQAFRSRWTEIQVGFVEDPAESVRDADGFVAEIAAALLSSFQARRTDLAAAWQQGSPGTEDLRQALRRYRAFLGVVLPE